MTNRFFAGQTNFIEELNALDGESGDAQQAIDDHIADTTGAHAASAISNTPAGNIAATTVQAAINELDAAKANLAGAAFTGAVSATSFTGPLSGNASTATTLATARNINGVSFNGSADITVTAAAGTLTGTTLAAGVTASSLTSVGTLTALTVSGTSTLGVTRVSGADGGSPPQFGVSGTSKGVRIVTTAGASSIEGVDNTLVGSYQPLILNASQLQFKINGGSTLLQLDAGAVSVGATLGVTGQASFAAGTAAAPSVKVGAGNEGLYSLGSGTLGLSANGRLALRLETVASSVNYLYGYANATGGAPVLRSVGSDTNVDLALGTQGSGAFAFLSHGATTLQFRIASVASATNFWQAQGNVTSGAPTLFANGTDTNVNALYSTKGTGQHFFYTNNAANLQFRVGHVANAVNYVTAYGNATGLTPGLFAEGSDASVGLGLYSKAAGPVFTAVRGAVAAYFDNPASPVNYATITGSATGNAVTISAQGSDTNIDFALTTKGTGVLRFGTHSALAAETVTGYITIKDSAGNTRKLAVVS